MAVSRESRIRDNAHDGALLERCGKRLRRDRREGFDGREALGRRCEARGRCLVGYRISSLSSRGAAVFSPRVWYAVWVDSGRRGRVVCVTGGECCCRPNVPCRRQECRRRHFVTTPHSSPHHTPNAASSITCANLHHATRRLMASEGLKARAETVIRL